jgi:thioredoxin 1
MSMKGLLTVVALAGVGASLWFGVFRQSAGALPAVFDQRPVEQVVGDAGDKLVVLNVSASWCGPCVAMKKETWSNGDVRAWFDRYGKAVYVDADENRHLAQEWGVRGIPAVIALKRGKEVARAGYMGPEEMVAWLDGLRRAN